jgi:hypothetical protein
MTLLGTLAMGANTSDDIDPFLVMEKKSFGLSNCHRMEDCADGSSPRVSFALLNQGATTACVAKLAYQRD